MRNLFSRPITVSTTLSGNFRLILVEERFDGVGRYLVDEDGVKYYPESEATSKALEAIHTWAHEHDVMPVHLYEQARAALARARSEK